MACPYFDPQEISPDKGNHPRLPLGDPYLGLCRANPHGDFRPDEATLRQACNLGYARRKCHRFPKDAGSDAVRFSMTGDEGGTLVLFYIIERTHSALAHGMLEFSTATGQFVTQDAPPLLLRQALAYIESYLRRKQHPEESSRNPHRR